MTEWISVKDRLPKDFDEDVLVYTSDRLQHLIASPKDWAIIECDYDCFVTHWMPLPEPPEVDNG